VTGRRRTSLAATGVLLAAGATAVILTVGGADEPTSAASAAHIRTAAVQRRDLVARATIDGTLGYADERAAPNRLTGTVTWLADEGAVVQPGHTLYRLDDARVLLLSGRRPAWRTLEPGMADGRDVLELERNLVKLGYDPGGDMTVDEEWTAATTAAVERFQDAVGLDDTGRLELGRVLFLPGARRISKHNAQVGDAAGPGRAVVTTTSTRREVTASLSADDQGAAKAGDRVEVDLPDGRAARGRIASVGTVAHAAQDGSATVDVTITLPAHGIPRLDQAPVSVAIARDRLRGAIAVPVTALLARPGGGYGVELVAGQRTRLVTVTPGLFADGWVAVDGVQPGQRVAVPTA
jgi:hypothetical protein